MLKSTLFILSFAICLNMSQAQTPDEKAAPSAATTPSLPEPAPSASNTISDLLGRIKNTSTGKYEEYQSICRLNEYDDVLHLKEDIKNKRIALLKNKIKIGKDVNKLKIRLFKELIDQHKSEEANELYTELKNVKLSSQENSLVEAYRSYSQKKLKATQTLLVKLVEPEIKNAEIAKFLAEIYREQNNYYEAAQIYEDLNKQASGGYYDLLCEALVLDSHHADGEKACKKATQEKPDSPYPVIYLGISDREKGLLPEAKEYFINSLKIKETEMGATCLAELYFMDNKFSQSVEYFKKSLEHSPESIRALIGLGWAQLKDKNTDEALVTFKKVCHTDKKYDVELRKAYKYLMTQNSPNAKKFIDLIQTCNE